MPHSKENNSRPVVYIFFGMIATGKSSISQAWAWYKQLRCYNSDWVRKELAGINPTDSRRESIDAGIYTKEFSQKTYKTLLDRVAVRLQQGNSVIVDASYQYVRDRQDIMDLAKRLNAKVYFILCQCPEAEMKRRMDLREKDPAAVSDGRWEIYLQQKERFEPPEEIAPSELLVLNTDAPLEDLLEKLEEKLP